MSLPNHHNPLRWEDLDPEAVDQLIRRALAEDLAGTGLRISPPATGDVTTAHIPADRLGCARLVNREPLVVCGLPILPRVLAETARQTGLAATATVVNDVTDGTYLADRTPFVTLRGPARLLLIAERTLLNFIQHLSGIATLTRRYREAMGDSPTQLLDTRKTTPGYRFLEKYAVGCGGGINHRLGLFDRILLKDNHLAAGTFAGGEALRQRIRDCQANHPGLAVEVEVDHPDQVEPAVEGGADYLMLDNFSDEDTRAAIHQVAGRCKVELSGGITLATLPAKARLGADFISTGAITHQSTWPDIGLDWEIE